MTVAVSCNLADGVILGVYSAVTLTDPKTRNVVKTYENAEKLIPLANNPIGIACYGLGGMGARSIGSYIAEFESTNPTGILTKVSTMKDIVEELRRFFLQKYQKLVVPQVEKHTKKKFEEIPDRQKPLIGLAIGGYSHGAYLAEVWELLIPLHQKQNSARLRRPQGSFGGDWFALNEPIFRYFKGYDRGLLRDMKDYFTKIRGSKFTKKEEKEISTILAKYEYPVAFGILPIKEGIAHVKVLVEMVINHHRFALGAPIVGGKAHIGAVTYKGKEFQILE